MLINRREVSSISKWKNEKMINTNDITLLMENVGFVDYLIHYNHDRNFTIYLHKQEYKTDIFKTLENKISNPIYSDIGYILKPSII